MRLKSKTICLLLLCYALSHPALQAQTAKKDDLVLDSAYAAALRQYHTYVSPDVQLYRGALYVDYAYTLKEGYPYFEDSLLAGAVIYNGLLYTNVPLLYDEVLDVVAIEDPYNIWKIALDREHVDSFTIESHQFVRLADTLNPTLPHHGYYEQLFRGGRVRLLRRETKTIQTQPSWQAQEFEKYTTTAVSFYLKKGDTYYPVNTKNSLLDALKDRKSEVKRFLRSNHLRLRKDKQNSLVKLITWYDGLPAR